MSNKNNTGMKNFLFGLSMALIVRFMDWAIQSSIVYSVIF